MDIDVSFLEYVERKLGRILATNRIESSMLDSMKRMARLSSSQLLVWKTKVKGDNDAYLQVLEESSEDVSETIGQIQNETKAMLDILQKLDAGASHDDADLITNSKWIRQNTRFEPLIITEDRDLLTCGHILTSFFGLTLGFLSCFELMRLLELEEPFLKYCKYYELGEDFGCLDDEWLKETLETSVSNGLRKAKIGCHPSPRGTGSLLSIIRR